MRRPILLLLAVLVASASTIPAATPIAAHGDPGGDDPVRDQVARPREELCDGPDDVGLSCLLAREVVEIHDLGRDLADDAVPCSGGTGGAPDRCYVFDHPPIRVAEDRGPQGFVVGRTPTGDPIYRPGSGVVDGTGTAEDPYLIADWTIPALDAAPAIRIEGTTAHVVVRNVTVVGNTPDEVAGIVVRGARNVTVEETRLRRVTPAVVVDESRRIEVLASRFTTVGPGVDVEASDRVTVADNRFEAVDGWDVQLHRSTDATVAGNRMVRGLSLDGDHGDHYRHRVDPTNTVQGRDLVYRSDATGGHVTGPVGQVLLVNVSGTDVRNVSAFGTDRLGIHVAYARNVTVSGLDVDAGHPSVALRIEAAEGATVEDNRFERSRADPRALELVETEQTTIRRNAFRGGAPVRVDAGDRTRIVQNDVQGTDGDPAFGLVDTRNATLSGNALRQTANAIGEGAIDLTDSRANLIADNTFRNPDQGDTVAVDGGHGNVLRDNLHIVETDDPRGGYGGVYIEGSDGNLVDGSTFRMTNGVSIFDGDDNRVVQADLGLGSTATAFDVHGGTGNRLTSSIVRQAADGAVVEDGARETTVAGNRLNVSNDAVRLESSDGAKVTGNRIVGNGSAETGIDVHDGTEDATIAYNTVREAAGHSPHEDYVGIALDGPSNVTVRRNVVEGAHHGIQVTGDDRDTLQIHDNDIVGNAVGLSAESGDDVATVDATWNWWGCPDGPDAADCNGVEGDVDADPWRTQPAGDG